ncbi:MAG: SRPBCC family protein, partial [Devosia sp.]
YLTLHPDGAHHVRVRFGLAVAPEVHAALQASGELDAWLVATLKFFDKVNAEDKFVVEGIHRGSASPLARPGPFSWMERELHDFAKYLDRRMNQRPPKASKKPLPVAAE